MTIPDGPWYNKYTRDWNVYVDGEVWRDADGCIRYFLTAGMAHDAVEAEVYGPRRAAARAERDA